MPLEVDCMVLVFAQVTSMPGTVGSSSRMGQSVETKVLVAAVSKVSFTFGVGGLHGGGSSSESNLVFCFKVMGCTRLAFSQHHHLVLKCMFLWLPPMVLSAVASYLWTFFSSRLRYLQVALVWPSLISNPHLKQ